MNKVDVAVVMGSVSDWETMQNACAVLTRFNVPYGAAIVSAHRTPARMNSFAEHAHASGVKVIIAGAGGAAHLPGMIAAQTTVPVLGVPIQSRALQGLDSLLSIVQMPAGIPTATFAIGNAGATNAGLFAVQLLATTSSELHDKLVAYRAELGTQALSHELPAPPLTLGVWE